MNEGYLTVFVTTANGTVPIENALVHIERAGEDARVLFTDRSGKTEKIALPAPSPSASMSAEQSLPFYTYRMRVSKEGFYTTEIENVPIFPGITAVQPINLVGTSFFPSNVSQPTDNIILVPQGPQVLDEKKEEE